MSARGVKASMPVDDLALAINGLANGLAIEEIADPDAVPDELLGHALVLMAAPQRSRGKSSG
jgi:hypothetical protein